MRGTGRCSRLTEAELDGSVDPPSVVSWAYGRPGWMGMARLTPGVAWCAVAERSPRAEPLCCLAMHLPAAGCRPTVGSGYTA